MALIEYFVMGHHENQRTAACAVLDDPDRLAVIEAVINMAV